MAACRQADRVLTYTNEALLVPDKGPLHEERLRCGKTAVGVVRHEVPSAEEPHEHARPGRRVGLPTLSHSDARAFSLAHTAA
jgi:hypothetical protein